MTPSEIKAERSRLALTQAAFAKLVGFSLQNVRAWEKGVSAPPADLKYRILLATRDVSALARLILQDTHTAGWLPEDEARLGSEFLAITGAPAESVVTVKQLAENTGLTVGRIRQMAPFISGGYKRGGVWFFPKDAHTKPPLSDRPKPGPKKR